MLCIAVSVLHDNCFSQYIVILTCLCGKTTIVVLYHAIMSFVSSLNQTAYTIIITTSYVNLIIYIRCVRFKVSVGLV